MDVVILLGLILLNGVFAMSEMAIISARKERLQILIDEGNIQAQIALTLAKNPNQFLSTVQIGITLVGILVGTLSGVTLAQNLSVVLGVNQSIAVTLVVILTTYLSLVVGELVPKRLALRHPEGIAIFLAQPIQWLSVMAKPIVWILSRSSDLVIWLLGVRPEDLPSISEKDILSLIQQGIPQGIFDEKEHELVEAIFRLDDQPAGGIITPRAEIIWLDINASNEEIGTIVSQNPYSAYPVCHNTVDDVIGMVRLRDLVQILLAPDEIALGDIIQNPLFIPQNVPSTMILERFKSSGVHTALIIGEYGGIQGLVSLHDMLEEFVGEIDPNDPEATRHDDGSWLIDGALPIRRMEDIFPNFKIPDDETGEYQSIAGFILKQLDYIPEEGEYFIWEDIYFEVIDMDNQRIDKILVKPMK